MHLWHSGGGIVGGTTYDRVFVLWKSFQFEEIAGAVAAGIIHFDG